MKEISGPLAFLVAALVVIGAMFLKVHDKATRLDACVKEYSPTESELSDIVEYCQEREDARKTGR
jgi:hypothetical protein